MSKNILPYTYESKWVGGGSWPFWLQDQTPPPVEIQKTHPPSALSGMVRLESGASHTAGWMKQDHAQQILL